MKTKELNKMTREEAEQYMGENVELFCDLLTGKILPELRNMLEVLDTAKACKQFQLAIMDVDAMAEGINSIKEDGYLPRLAEIPLSQSEVEETFSFER